MAEIYSTSRIVRFGECDPAGVVYYPVYFNWFHETMESWFEEGLGFPYAEFLLHYGFPAVETSAQFRKPVVVGERIDIELRVEEMGNSSILLVFSIISTENKITATGKVRCVCIQQTKEGFEFQSTPIPHSLRDSILAYLI
jgi:4-hydroxybenzoyl-CoA thioesterase